MINRLFLIILTVFLLASCKSNKANIEVKDNSSITASRDILFKKLDSIYNYRVSNIKSYDLQKARIEVNLGGSSHKVNGRLTLETNKQMKASISIPFPPLTVGSLNLDRSTVSISSSFADIDMTKNVPTYFLPVISSLLYGAMPMDVIGQFKLNNIFIKDYRYHLQYSGPFNSHISFQIDQLFRICQLSVSNPDFSGDMFASEFSKVDTHDLPSNIRFIVSSKDYNGSVSIQTNTIKLNK